MTDFIKCFNITKKHSDIFLDQKLEKFDLCSCHRIYIKKVIEHPGVTRDQIKSFAHVHPSNITRSIDYLEEKGFIKKVIKEEDRRICELYPTDSLKEVYDVLIEAENEWDKIVTEGLSEEEVELYRNFLKLSAHLSAKFIHNEK